MQVQFYHLRHSPLHQALPALTVKAYRSGYRICITAEPTLLPTLDEALWSHPQEHFLPHAQAHEAQAARTPIVLNEQPTRINAATLLMITNGVQATGEARAFERVLDIFDGHESAQVQRARERWTHYQKQGDTLTYIRQRETGGWEELHA